MSLTARLAARIAREGPLDIAAFMDVCLHDPDDGYYATRPRLGADGDFITAPHVSQMFGELIGLWAAEVWAGLGRPDRCCWIEVGPGDGTLMRDARRAAVAAAGFLDACDLWLLETSVPLAALQAKVLGENGVRWASHLDETPRGRPIILIANEWLDCLPVRQAVATPAGWRERCVGVDGGGRLAFVLGDAPSRDLPPAPPGTVVEWSEALERAGEALGRRLMEEGGAALLIDYGSDSPGFGDTLQALRAHRKEGPLDNPGEADLTAHVNFPSFLAAAKAAGAQVTEVSSQGDFLWSLGLGLRAERLIASHPERRGAILSEVDRLIDPSAMGQLFKVAALWSGGPPPPGLRASGRRSEIPR